ncbi:Aminopeptidase 2 mitochondrial [Polyrhizophydium stewartii]|uniref:Aminopeptidase 2 mitochondrial n=1 Tax=Polyrhizophydium stewartii TaxID=2732419 RepID=A0ABR4N025_9FUNG|nr:hypothetical protein HK105_008013 [Polyrhizophydium stewartii]
MQPAHHDSGGSDADDDDQQQPLLLSRLAARYNRNRQHARARRRTCWRLAALALALAAAVALALLRPHLPDSGRPTQPQPTPAPTAPPDTDPAPPEPAPRPPGYRLPAHVAPWHYRLSIAPRLDKLAFDGAVEVELQIRRAVPAIELHADPDSLAVSSVTLWRHAASSAGSSSPRPLAAYETRAVAGRLRRLAPNPDQLVAELAAWPRSREPRGGFVGDGLEIPTTWRMLDHPGDVLRVVSTGRQSVLQPGNYTLALTFSGTIGDKTMSGFYRSEYVANSTTSWVAITHFEPTAARSAFPCFDEPHLKATFDVSVALPPPWHALSNSPLAAIISLANDPAGHVISRSSSPDLRVFTFERTIPLSTYLVAWAVSDYVHAERAVRDDLSVRIWFAPGADADAAFSLDVAVRSVAVFESAINVPLPMSKIDLLPVPDYSAEAMENWGLITFDSSLLLVPPDADTLTKMTAALLVAHELAHYWFGDLVTMAWWDNLWLNEGFAEFMQYVGAQSAIPEMDLDAQFFWLEHMLALHADASHFTHPIVVDVVDPESTPALFDDISYNKGASVLRMMSRIVNVVVAADTEITTPRARGPAVAGKRQRSTKTSAVSDDPIPGGQNSTLLFRALASYIRNHMFSVAGTTELWADMDAVLRDAGVKLHLSAIMRPWVEQPGFPTVRITFNASTNAYELSQSRFTLLADADPRRCSEREDAGDEDLEPARDRDEIRDQTWPIVLTYRFVDESGAPRDDETAGPRFVIMKSKTSVIPIPQQYAESTAPPLLVANLDSIGVFRVEYEPSLALKIAAVVSATQVSDDDARDPDTASALGRIDRAGFVSDVIALALSGRGMSSLAGIRQALAFLERETSAAVWKAALDGLLKLNDALPRHPDGATAAEAVAATRSWMAGVVDGIGVKVGWTRNQNGLMDVIRADVLQAAVVLGSPQTLLAGKRLYENITSGWSAAKAPMHVDLPAGMSAEVFSLVIGAGIATSSPSEFVRLLSAARAAAEVSSRLPYEDWLAVVKGLAFTPSPLHLDLLLDFVQGAPRIHGQDTVAFYRVLAQGSLSGAQILWSALREQFESGTFVLTGGSNALAEALEAAIARFRDPVFLRDARAFVRGADKAGGKGGQMARMAARTVERGLERARAAMVAVGRLAELCGSTIPQ